MTIRQAIWRIGAKPEPLQSTLLANEVLDLSPSH
jgi:hypothetical protein